MTRHQTITATPLYSTPADLAARILSVWDDLTAKAARHVPTGVLTAADLHGLRRRTATMTGATVEQVADTITRRDAARRAELRPLGPRHAITRGIE